MVSNIFTYGLLFGTMRASSITRQIAYLMAVDLEWFVTYIVVIPPIQEGITTFIFFISALIASLKGHQQNVPIPRGMVKHVLYIFSCVCCCVCCSPGKREKTVKVLVMLGFMSFIYHNIMDGISITFLLFIEESRASVITFTTLYVSLVLFLVLVISYSLYTIVRGINSNDTACEQIFTRCGSTFMLITVFPAVMLMVIMYMVIVFSLDLKGVAGIVTGLIPSIALSAASWYIKKRLEKEVSQSNTATSQLPQSGATGEAMNDGEREETEDSTDDRQMLLP